MAWLTSPFSVLILVQGAGLFTTLTLDSFICHSTTALSLTTEMVNEVSQIHKHRKLESNGTVAQTLLD